MKWLFLLSKGSHQETIYQKMVLGCSGRTGVCHHECGLADGPVYASHNAYIGQGNGRGGQYARI